MLNAELEGKVYPALTFSVTAEGIHLYAAATNETNSAFTGESPTAPPAFPIVAAGEAIRAVFNDEALGVNMPRLVQADETHTFHAPLKAGDVLEVVSRLSEVQAGEAGEKFVILTDLTNQEGMLAVELRSSMIIRGSGKRARAAAAAKADEQEAPSPEFETTESVDDDQTYRYAEASGDRNLIHIDPEFAKNSAGLPGIIVHGMCTMAFASRAVLNAIAAGDPLRLRKIKVEFSRPVFPGQELTTRGWGESEKDGIKSYVFETLNPRGQQVIKKGQAEVGS